MNTDGHRYSTTKNAENAENANREPQRLILSDLFVRFVVKRFAFPSILICVHLCPSVVKILVNRCFPAQERAFCAN